MATQISNASTTCAENLVSVNNGKIVTTSLQVAEVFNKLHRHVLRDIRNLECSSNFQESNFGLSFYHSKLLNGGYKKQPMYYITRDGFTFLAMGFTGKIAARFKEAYINAFNEMERKLSGITVREDEIINIIRELCADVNSRIKGHEKMLKKEHGVRQAGDMSGLSLLRRGTIKEQLTNIFATLNNNIMSGQFAWAKLEKVEKENKEMKRELAKVASKLLNYYY
jgi:Rha family phage regulatory protein